MLKSVLHSVHSTFSEADCVLDTVLDLRDLEMNQYFLPSELTAWEVVDTLRQRYVPTKGTPNQPSGLEWASQCLSF